MVHQTLARLGALAIALYAAYVVFELAWRARSTGSASARGWMLGGALVGGSGLWASQFLGMLALRSPAALAFDPGYAVWAWLVAIGYSYAWLALARRPGPAWAVIAGGAVLGAVLAALHALAAQALAVTPGYGFGMVSTAFAAGLAAVAAAAALALRRQHDTAHVPGARQRMAPAALFGVAIAGSHALQIHAGGVAPQAVLHAGGTMSGPTMALLVVFFAVALLTFGLFAAALDARMQSETHKLATSLRQANDELQRIAFIDPLTQLPNRLVFEERLLAEVARCEREHRPLAVLFIDLDGFKPVNDTYGHPAGDAVLRQIGQRLRALARASDAVARVGGDEFLMLIDGPADAAAVSTVAQRVMDAVERPCLLLGDELPVSCSIGIAMYPQHGPKEKLIANADAAMYSAKRSGGSTFAFFETRMDVDLHEQMELLRDLRSAIERRELEMFYQPKVHARSGQITGAEALIRWRHPVRGMVSPALFIPIAERFGLIGTLGDWVIDDACRQIRAWMEQGLRMRVAVNLSMQQLRQDNLVDRIRDAMFRHRVEPGLMTFEVTESVAMEDPAAAQSMLDRLARLGVSISIDDFGTGHSSLSYLRKLPAKQIKIDRSFVNDLGQSEDARAVVDAVVRLAHALDLKVVAEGVETEAQRDILLGLNCDEFQGYLFAKPMSAVAMTLWAMNDDGPASIGFRESLFGELNSPRRIPVLASY